MLLNVGDRVRFCDGRADFLVVEVNRKMQSVSIVPYDDDLVLRDIPAGKVIPMSGTKGTLHRAKVIEIRSA